MCSDENERPVHSMNGTLEKAYSARWCPPSNIKTSHVLTVGCKL